VIKSIKKSLELFYRKVKKFCFVVGFLFYLNSNKKLLMLNKNLKKKKKKKRMFTLFDLSEKTGENCLPYFICPYTFQII
jgi:hypothetical protein